eukprot:3408722-Rhodomonas_salina.2
MRERSPSVVTSGAPRSCRLRGGSLRNLGSPWQDTRWAGLFHSVLRTEKVAQGSSCQKERILAEVGTGCSRCDYAVLRTVPERRLDALCMGSS